MRHSQSFALPLLFGAIVFAGCGGGGGSGGGSTPQLPEIVSIVFTGSSPSDSTPDPGDTLTLFFTKTVRLSSGDALDDSRLELSSGTLGTGVGAPTQPDDTSLRITLGTGTAFTVGTATAKLAAGQTLVTDEDGKPVNAAISATIQLSDGVRPTISFLTLNATPSELNGSGGAGGLMQVPPNGFTIDASYADPGGVVAPSGTVLLSNREVRVDGATLPAFTNLYASLSPTTVGPTAFQLTVPASVAFTDGDHLLSVAVRDTSGLMSLPVTFTMRVRGPSTNDRPLESGQTWFLDLSRDLETLTSSDGAGSFVILNAPVTGANGTPDFYEDLVILGLRTGTPIANVSGSKDSNEVTLDLLKAAILADLQRYYAGTSVTFTFDDPGPFPSTRPFVDYAQSSHSRISVGGATSASGALGTAIFDPNNRTQDNNTLDAGTYSGVTITDRLGVFLHTLLEGDINRFGSQLRADFDLFIRFRGVPVGEDAGDGTRLQNLLSSTPGDSRQTFLGTAIANFGRFVAVVLAHECGHSLGLVNDEAMPVGLYGGLSSSFPGSSPGHLDLSSTSIFPATAIEIMTPAISYEAAIDAATNFNPLIRSYLLERSFYDAK